MITVARTAGFCFGVDRAVNTVYQLLKEGGQVATLGPIIHNPQLVKSLEEKGVRTVGTPEEVLPGEALVIRSHGVGQSVYDEIAERGLSMVDATCPFVLKIHRIVSECSAKGATVLIAGDKNHPEVLGIKGHCSGPVYIFDGPEELRELLESGDFDQNEAVMVAQTTFHMGKWKSCVEFIKKLYTKTLFFDTICNATANRQEEAAEIAQKVDLMVVVGGRESSNTAKLRDVCARFVETLLVETAAELDLTKVRRAKKIGLTAGASTPAGIIKEVYNTMSETQAALENEDFNFEEALEQSLKTVHTNEKVIGVVTAIAPNEVQIDIGTKHAGFIPLSELTDDPSAKAEDLVKKGDELNLVVLRVNDAEGTVMLSKKRYDSIAGAEKVNAAFESGEILEGTVIEVVKGGVVALCEGTKVFIPASQATLRRGQDLETLVKQPVRFRIIEQAKGRRRPIGSIRSVLAEERKEKEDQFWSEIEIGKTYTGEVKSLTSYGAFVDLGGVDGMIHITELSWKRIKHPSEVVNVGDTVEVYVKDVDEENRKISLGYRKAEDNPWEVFKKEYNVGDVVKATIVSLAQYGAFARIVDGVDGLIHISQISNERINKVSDVLEKGQEVEVKIIDIDFDAKRVSLSMRALQEPAPARSMEADAVVGSTDDMDALKDVEVTE